ncbi:hypothetical protein BOTBODRAFT_34170 [Botryobasidium botryosum FD-172 SS1]|uniref:MHC class I region proline-rich protein CAT53 n=1 Tax=Botryobasidium botryosum (strain FD-172 SS1) TaxID=930990 RepID=A0A067MAV5_BOTB1|nr:hypothetical protein BOTBODRAFT_34170 [Botryobasidium botryosum FD-172 SS1]
MSSTSSNFYADHLQQPWLQQQLAQFPPAEGQDISAYLIDRVLPDYSVDALLQPSQESAPRSNGLPPNAQRPPPRHPQSQPQQPQQHQHQQQQQRAQQPQPQPQQQQQQSSYDHHAFLEELGLGSASSLAPEATINPSHFYQAPPPQQYATQSLYPNYSHHQPYGSLPLEQPQHNGHFSHFPLTSYSSLNGATSSSSPHPHPQLHLQIPSPQPQQQQSQQSPQSHQMAIDPQLVSMHPISRSPYGMPHNPYLSPSLLYAHQSPVPSNISASQSPKTNPYQANPGRSPVPGSTLISIPPSPIPPPSPGLASSSAPPPRDLLPVVRDLLTPQMLDKSPSQSASLLINHLSDMPETNREVRLEILAKMRDGAPREFFSVWAKSIKGLDLLREWLKAAVVRGREWEDTLMPLLHVIDRLPLSVDDLKASKLGKVIVKVVKDPPTSAIKDMAMGLESKWRDMLETHKKNADGQAQNGTAAGEAGKKKGDEVSKKRKPLEPPSKVPPGKRAATGSPAFGASSSSSSSSAPTATPLASAASSNGKPVVVKREIKGLPAVTKDAKSDSSFFSAPKPKPKLPTFKKVVKKEPLAGADVGVSQPSNIDPFQEALKSMSRPRGGQGVGVGAGVGAGDGASSSSGAVSTPPFGAGASGSAASPAVSGSGVGPGVGAGAGDSVAGQKRKRKSVTFAPDDKLEQIKYIEKAIYDDDLGEGTHHHQDLRELDRSEGQFMHQRPGFEEGMDWVEPIAVELPSDLDVPPRGAESQERATQEEREQTALTASYMSLAQVPDSPAEPPHVAEMQTQTEGDESQTKMMILGEEAEALVAPSATINDLLAQIAGAPVGGGGQPPPQMPQMQIPPTADPAAAAATLQQLGINLSASSFPTLFNTPGLGGLALAQAGGPSHMNGNGNGHGGGSPYGHLHQPQLPYGGEYQQQQQQQYSLPEGDQNHGWGGLPPPTGFGQGWEDDGYGGGGGSERGGGKRGRGRRGGFGDSGWRGRGRGRGGGVPRARQLCNFFAQGKCRYGDACDFLHDPSLLG